MAKTRMRCTASGETVDISHRFAFGRSNRSENPSRQRLAVRKSGGRSCPKRRRHHFFFAARGGATCMYSIALLVAMKRRPRAAKPAVTRRLNFYRLFGPWWRIGVQPFPCSIREPRSDDRNTTGPRLARHHWPDIAQGTRALGRVLRCGDRAARPASAAGTDAMIAQAIWRASAVLPDDLPRFVTPVRRSHLDRAPRLSRTMTLPPRWRSKGTALATDWRALGYASWYVSCLGGNSAAMSLVAQDRAPASGCWRSHRVEPLRRAGRDFGAEEIRHGVHAAR